MKTFNFYFRTFNLKLNRPLYAARPKIVTDGAVFQNTPYIADLIWSLSAVEICPCMLLQHSMCQCNAWQDHAFVFSRHFKSQKCLRSECLLHTAFCVRMNMRCCQV